MLISKKPIETVVFIFNAVILCFCCNSFLLMRAFPRVILPIVLLFIVANLLTLFSPANFPNFRTNVCNHGVKLLVIFIISIIPSAVYHIFLPLFLTEETRWALFFYSLLTAVLAHAIVFWNGILAVYTTSVQLGIKERVIGIICAFIPLANVIFLLRIIQIVGEECRYETKKHLMNLSRKSLRVCKTKYPIILIHGVFFRDAKLLNYWGRIPAELERNGATVYYGEHQSALAVADSAAELKERILHIINETGCQKVNIIAHSKGGLDSRYAIHYLGLGPYVASLTTINSPHRGCLFADYLLEKIPPSVQAKLAKTYNTALKKLGDKNPDFTAAVNDLTSAACFPRDRAMTVPKDIFCQSVGSVMRSAGHGQFPLNMAYPIAKMFDGPNDSVVGEKSFYFGNKYTLLTTTGKRGISHADVTDLFRDNIKDFDVREFYVSLVSDLKERGY
ncbi:MAG: triacylglycerol lipase [Clostridia bacterium]|nr:triacylglycerol lipase [Clostridia bacterium]